MGGDQETTFVTPTCLWVDIKLIIINYFLLKKNLYSLRVEVKFRGFQ